jgi:hypothetical protein
MSIREAITTIWKSCDTFELCVIFFTLAVISIVGYLLNELNGQGPSPKRPSAQIEDSRRKPTPANQTTKSKCINCTTNTHTSTTPEETTEPKQKRKRTNDSNNQTNNRRPVFKFNHISSFKKPRFHFPVFQPIPPPVANQTITTTQLQPSVKRKRVGPPQFTLLDSFIEYLFNNLPLPLIALDMTLEKMLSNLCEEDMEYIIENLNRREIQRRVQKILNEMDQHLWIAIFNFLINSDPRKEEDIELFKIGCVCREWNKIANSLIVDRYKFDSCKSDKVLNYLVVTRDKHDFSSEFYFSDNPEYGGTLRTNLEELFKLESRNSSSSILPSWRKFRCPVVRKANLFLFTNKTITNYGLRNLGHVVSLELGDHDNISDEGIEMMTQIKKLDLWKNEKITDKAVAKFMNLTRLNLDRNSLISDDVVSLLKDLSDLSLSGNSKITDKSLRCLTNLKVLKLNENEMITSYGIQNCKKLSMLFLNRNKRINDEGLIFLRNSLEFLTLNENDLITDESLRFMTNLAHLELDNNIMISDQGISTLCKLEDLNISYNLCITVKGLRSLTNMRTLFMFANDTIPDEDIKSLKIEYVGREERKPALSFEEEKEEEEPKYEKGWWK